MLECFACKEKLRKKQKMVRNSSFLDNIKRSDNQDQGHDRTEEDLVVKKTENFSELNEIDEKN